MVTNSRDEWERTFNICWGGVYNCTRAFLPMLQTADEGHIVNTSSVNGFWASIGPRVPHTAYKLGSSGCCRASLIGASDFFMVNAEIMRRFSNLQARSTVLAGKSPESANVALMCVGSEMATRECRLIAHHACTLGKLVAGAVLTAAVMSQAK